MILPTCAKFWAKSSRDGFPPSAMWFEFFMREP
jgi:hypothetical protein